MQHIGKLLVLWRPPALKAKEPREDAYVRSTHRTPRQIFKQRDTTADDQEESAFWGNQRVTAGGMIKRAKRRAASIKKKRLA